VGRGNGGGKKSSSSPPFSKEDERWNAENNDFGK
jgi:hypothetical protein